MKKRSFWFVLCGSVVLFTALGSLPCLAQVNMNEGKWEVTSEVNMEGMPIKMPATKTTQCITKNDMVPAGGSSNCKVLSQSVAGNRVTWKVRCVDKDATTEGEGEIIYSGASYKGNMTARMTDKTGKTQNITMKLSGQRVGECGEADKKETDRYQAMAEQAKAGQQEYEAKTKKGEELAKTAVVLEEGPNACLLSDNSCGVRFGQLSLQEGEWEMTEEMTTMMKDSGAPTKSKTPQAAPKEIFTPVTSQAAKRCFSQQEALSYTADQGCVKEDKRSGDRITWKYKCTYQGTATEEKGSITYSGGRYEGARIKKTSTPGAETTQITKLSGKRLGEGSCIAKRDGSPRDKGVNTATEPHAPEKAIDKPVKALKKIFGF
jgi:hypothetical protein